MITYLIKAGTADVSVVLRAIDSVDGTPETGFDETAAGIDLKYRREGADNVNITETSLVALTTAHTDGGVEQIGNGYFRLDLPDAACVAGVSGVMVHGVATGMVIIGCYIQLVPYDLVTSGNSTSLATISDLSTDADIIAAINADVPDVNVKSVNDVTVTGTGASPTFWGP